MIRIEHLKKQYPKVTPLKDVTVTINKGDVISVIGPSGCGKSTLIRCMNLLDPPTEGKIFLDGEDITDSSCRIDLVRRKMGMVFQSFNLFNHLTVIENIMAAPVDLLGKTKQEAYDKAMELLRSVDLADKALSYPDELSGGQKQRVAIVRTLAMEPEVILFDEPTSALDPAMIGEVERVIRNLANKGMTMLIVTHDMRFAKEIANRVFYMDLGGIYEDGPPSQIFDNPQKERTRNFIFKKRTVEKTITSRDFDFIGFNSDIEEFGRKNRISQKTIYRMQSAFEELCLQIILPTLESEFKVNVTLDYDAKEETAIIIFKYTGMQEEPFTGCDPIALQLARGITEKMEYSAISEDDYTNCVYLRIK